MNIFKFKTTLIEITYLLKRNINLLTKIANFTEATSSLPMPNYSFERF